MMATAVMVVATWRRGGGGGGASSRRVGYAATAKWRVTLNRRSLVMMLAHKSLLATGRGRALEVRASATACESSRAWVSSMVGACARRRKRCPLFAFFSSVLKVRRDDGHKTASSVGGTFVSGVAGTEGEAEREGTAAAVRGVAGVAPARAAPLCRSMRMCDGGARGGSWRPCERR